MSYPRRMHSRFAIHNVQGGGKYLLLYAWEAVAHFPHANECCKQKGKANAIGRLTALCGKCCVTGTETSTVPQCVPLEGERERAKEGGRGGDFLFMRALALKGFS